MVWIYMVLTLVIITTTKEVLFLCACQLLEDVGIDTIDWSPRSPYLNPTEDIWDIVFGSIWHHQVAPQNVQDLNDALVQICFL